MSEKAATVEFGVISDWDIESANDENYVQSSDSIEIVYLRAMVPISPCCYRCVLSHHVSSLP
jgi:hypothetical protein